MKETKFFLIFIVLYLTIPLYSGDEFVEKHCWRFENTTYFTDGGGNTVLPWEIYARSFIGISPDSNTAKVLCPLDYAFYKAYNAAFAVAAGNCFGMSLLANIIYKEEGHMGFCKPIYTYSGDFNGPASAKLCTTITVMQCHEWSHSGILWMAENILGTHVKDPNYAYEQVEYYLSMGDLPVITLVKNSDLVGHTLIPYKLEESGGKRYIYIHDPNKWYPHDSTFYDDHENYIEITVGSDNWSYQFDDTTEWGSPNGYIFATPMSTVKASSRNPLQLGGVTDAMNDVFLTGAHISQISDSEGRKFYKTSANSHNRLSEIEDDTSQRIKGVFRMPMTFAGSRTGKEPPELYFAIGPAGRDLNFEIASVGKEYKFEMAGKGNVVKLSSPPGASGRDNIVIREISTDRQEIKLSSERGVGKFALEIFRDVPGSAVSRKFRVSNLQVSRTSPVKLRLTERRDALLVKGEKGPVSCELEVSQIAGGKITEMPKRIINVSGETWQQIAPDNWNKLQSADVEVKKLELLKKPPEPLGKQR